MSLTPEVMRSCILEALRGDWGQQYIYLKDATARVAQARGEEIEERQPGYGPTLLRTDTRRLLEAIWALIFEGVLMVGMNEDNAQWPWLSLTEYGREVISAADIVPHDTEGYLRALATVQALDAVEERYLPQALEAFRRNLPDAAALMLGAASEHILIQLGEAIAANDQLQATAARKKLDGPALGLLIFIQDYLTRRRRQLPRDLNESLDTTFGGIASLIRVTRNDAGHPAIARPVDRDQAFVTLRLFPTYRAWVRSVISRLPL